MDLLGLGIILGTLIPLMFTPREYLSRIAVAISILIGAVLILGSHFGLFGTW